MRSTSPILLGVFVTLALAGATACSGPTTAFIRGVEPLNVNEHDESTSVRLRIYQLKDDGRFRNATYEHLWDDDVDALGDDRLGEPIERVVQPGLPDAEPTEVKFELDSAARFIAVFAMYGPKQRSTSMSAVLRRVLQVRDAEDFIFELRHGEVVLVER